MDRDDGAVIGSPGIEQFPNRRGAFALARDKASKTVVLWLDAAHESLLDTIRRFDAAEVEQNLKALENLAPDDPDLPLYRRMTAADRLRNPGPVDGPVRKRPLPRASISYRDTMQFIR